MDPETTRLALTAMGAVIAGIGGALVAGRFNRKIATASFEATQRASLGQDDRNRELEHFRWHRDQKLIAYQNFLVAAEEFAATWDSEAPSTNPATLRAARAHVKALGSVAARMAAAEVIYDTVRLRHLVEINSVEGNSREVSLRVDELGKSIDAYIDAIRSDLSVATELDASLRKQDVERRFAPSLPRSRDLDRYGGDEEEEE